MTLRLVRKSKDSNARTLSFLRTDLLRLKGSQLELKIKLMKIEKNKILRTILR